MQCYKVVFEEECSCIHKKDGKWTELVLQGNVYWLEAKFFDGKAESKLLCDMNSVEMRAPEDQGKRTHRSAKSSSMQQTDIRKELIERTQQQGKEDDDTSEHRGCSIGNAHRMQRAKIRRRTRCRQAPRMSRQMLMARRAEFGCGQEIRQEVSGTNTKQHISRCGAGARVVSKPRCQGIGTGTVVQSVTCQECRWATSRTARIATA